MFSQHRKQPVPLTKLRSSQRMSRGAGLQGPIIVGLGSTTSSFERRKRDWWLENADIFVFPLFVRQLWTRPSAHLLQSGLMFSITEYIWPSCVALNDVNDKDGNDGDVKALSAALTDPGCMATLWSLSLRRLSNLALKFCSINVTLLFLFPLISFNFSHAYIPLNVELFWFFGLAHKKCVRNILILSLKKQTPFKCMKCIYFALVPQSRP